MLSFASGVSITIITNGCLNERCQAHHLAKRTNDTDFAGRNSTHDIELTRPKFVRNIACHREFNIWSRGITRPTDNVILAIRCC